MLDLKYVLANAEEVKQNCKDRNVSQDIIEEVDHIIRLESEIRILRKEVEEIHRKQNEVAKAISKEVQEFKKGLK